MAQMTNILGGWDIANMKFFGIWVLEISRHKPIALGASGALGVGWDTPRSIKIGHAPVGTILRPPQTMVHTHNKFVWGKFALHRRERPKTKHAWSRGQTGWFWHGGEYFLSVFCPRETHTRRLVDISTHISRRGHF